MERKPQLIGRETELVQLRALVDDHRLITVVGPGGVGKTTLVEQALLESDGVLFGRLADLPAADLDEAFAGSLGFSSFRDLTATIAASRSVVVVDNCEHIIEEAAELVDALLRAGPYTRIIATSREHLGLRSERVMALQPLDTSGHESAASELFVQRMLERGVEPPSDREAITELVQQLEGLPLAIELAASRTIGMTPSDISEHLGTRLDLLSRQRGAAHERHASISAAVAWSYQLLDDDLKELFLNSCVFPGAFSPQMVSALGSGDEAEITDRLLALVERSLLVLEPVAGRSWYRTLSTIRGYGRERLIDEGRLSDLEQKLVDVVCELAEALSTPEVVQAEPQAIHEMQALFRTLRHAVDVCLERDKVPDRARALIAPLWALENTGHQGEAADVVARVIDRWEITEAAPLGIHAMMLRSAGDFDHARTVAERCIAVGGSGTYLGRRNLGLHERVDGNYAASIDHFTDGAAEARADGFEAAALEMELHAGLARARGGDPDKALEEFDRIERVGSAYPMVLSFAPSMAALTLLGIDLGAAMAAADRSYEAANIAGYTWVVNQALGMRSLAMYLSGDRDGGAALLADVIDKNLSQASRAETWIGLRVAAAMFSDAGDVDSAASTLRSANQLFAHPILGADETRAIASISADAIDTTYAQSVPIPELLDRLRNLGDAPAGIPKKSSFAQDGDVWHLAFRGEGASIKDSKGMHDLAHLLSQPRKEVASLDLMQSQMIEGEAGTASDLPARRSYEARIRDLQEDIAEAETNNDAYRAERAAEELDALVDHLARSYGLGGDQRTVGDVAEKARSAVTWRIRAAIKRIDAEIPALGDHLSRSIQTGRFCVYDPPDAITWEIAVG